MVTQRVPSTQMAVIGGVTGDETGDVRGELGMRRLLQLQLVLGGWPSCQPV